MQDKLNNQPQLKENKKVKKKHLKKKLLLKKRKKIWTWEVNKQIKISL